MPRKAPSTVADFTVVPLTLPSLSSLPSTHQETPHYLYIKPHEPSAYTATAERSLFVANIPIDSSETNIRALFANELGGARVESVDFDSSVPARPLHKRWKQDRRIDDGGEGEIRGKKRKRNDAEVIAEGVVEDEDSALPALWASEVRRSGSTAVVVFVDKRSARGAMKEAQNAVKSGRTVAWKSGSGLGVEREFDLFIFISKKPICTNLTINRLQDSSATHISECLCPPVLHKRIPLTVHLSRIHSCQVAQARPHRARRRRFHNRDPRRSCRPGTTRRGREEAGRIGGKAEEQWCQGRLLQVPEP